MFGIRSRSAPEIEPDWRVAEPSDEEPYSEVYVPAPSAAVEGSDEEPFSLVYVREPTLEERLAHYALYRRMGGEPYEPNESLFQGQHLNG
jgi:hypothetical protein